MRANVLSYLRAYGQSALRRFDRLSDRRLRDLIRGAAAVLGRGVESTGVFGWVTGDRLRRMRLIITTKL